MFSVADSKKSSSVKVCLPDEKQVFERGGWGRAAAKTFVIESV